MSSSCRSMQGSQGTTTDREIEKYSRRPITEGAFYAFRTDRRATRTFALIFDRGDENASALKRFAIEHRISGSSFIAIRARSSAKLGWLSDTSLRARAWISHHVGLRLIDPDAAVVFHKTEFANAIHEEADAGSRSPDHVRQRFLGELGTSSSDSIGLPNSAINKRIPVDRLLPELKSRSTRSLWIRILRGSGNNTSARRFSADASSLTPKIIIRCEEPAPRKKCRL
jgi:hypothetical protein